MYFPGKELIWIFEKIHDIAKQELQDTEEKLKRELFEAQNSKEMGKISEEEYKKREKNILERLQNLKSEKKSK